MKINGKNFVKQLRNGNEKALEYVIDNYSYIISGVINKHLFYLQDRKDECLNDVLMAIWENIDSFDEDKEFSNWIAGISKYKSLDYLRKYLKDRELENIDKLDVTSGDTTLEKILLDEFNDGVKEILKYLNIEDEQIFKETYFNEKSADEISDEMKLDKSLIYNRLSRGRKKLRLMFGGRNYEE